MVKIAIKQQGAPRVNNGCVAVGAESIKALEVDMHSKYCNISATTGGDIPGVMISEDENSLHLHKTKKGDTWIEFPQFKGWTVWSASIGRCTLYVCLVKFDF